MWILSKLKVVIGVIAERFCLSYVDLCEAMSFQVFTTVRCSKVCCGVHCPWALCKCSGFNSGNKFGISFRFVYPVVFLHNLFINLFMAAPATERSVCWLASQMATTPRTEQGWSLNTWIVFPGALAGAWSRIIAIETHTDIAVSDAAIADSSVVSCGRHSGMLSLTIILGTLPRVGLDTQQV